MFGIGLCLKQENLSYLGYFFIFEWIFALRITKYSNVIFFSDIIWFKFGSKTSYVLIAIPACSN